MTGRENDDLFAPSLGAGPEAPPSADLYAPSLDDSHDAVDIEPPWRPNALLIPVFLGEVFFSGGAYAGAILYSFNARCLGRKRDWRWIVPLFCAAGLATDWVFLEFGLRLKADPQAISATTIDLLRFGTRFGIVLIAFLIGRKQKQRYRLYMGADRPLFVPVLGAIAAGWILGKVSAFAVAFAYVGVAKLLGIDLPTLE